jgi:hypothetical protein
MSRSHFNWSGSFDTFSDPLGAWSGTVEVTGVPRGTPKRAKLTSSGSQIIPSGGPINPC